MAQSDVTSSPTKASAKAELKKNLTIRTAEYQTSNDVKPQEVVNCKTPEDQCHHGDEGVEDCEDGHLEVLSRTSSTSECRSDTTWLTEPEVSSEKGKTVQSGRDDETVEAELSVLGPEWWQKSPPHEVMSQMQLTFFQYHQKTMMATAQTMGLAIEDLDIDEQGKLALKESAFASGRSSRRSDPEKEITVQDLFIDEHGLVRVNDSACDRLGLPPYRYPWESDESEVPVDEDKGASDNQLVSS